MAPEICEHLKFIDEKHHRLVEQTAAEQLTYEPDVRTKNRKPLRPPEPFGAGWEIRFGPKNSLRLFYSFDLAARTVLVLAVGVKEGSRLLVGGEEYES